MRGIDPEELGRWFDAYAPQLVLYARQWLAAGAEDVVQEVFVHLALERREPRDVKAYLFRAVRNAAISALRSERRRESRQQRAMEARPAWFEPKGDDLVDAAAAQEALGELPAAQREIIVLRIWAGMTLADVAQISGLPLSTVHDHYRKALEAIRRRMESRCQARNQ